MIAFYNRLKEIGNVVSDIANESKKDLIFNLYNYLRCFFLSIGVER